MSNIVVISGSRMNVCVAIGRKEWAFTLNKSSYKNKPTHKIQLGTLLPIFIINEGFYGVALATSSPKVGEERFGIWPLDEEGEFNSLTKYYDPFSFKMLTENRKIITLEEFKNKINCRDVTTAFFALNNLRQENAPGWSQKTVMTLMLMFD